MNNGKMNSWQMVELKQAFNLVEQQIPEPGEGEVIVKIAGCGVCHTDLSFWCAGVKTKHALPLTLGHEISGTVINGPAVWVGKKVIIPAVLPCGECELCKKGIIIRPMDIYGFSTYIRITVGNPEDNQGLIRALYEVIGDCYARSY